jgi:hypothetical protein
MELVGPGLDEPIVRLGHLVPGARKVAERLRDDDPGLVGQHRQLFEFR